MKGIGTVEKHNGILKRAEKFKLDLISAYQKFWGSNKFKLKTGNQNLNVDWILVHRHNRSGFCRNNIYGIK